MRFFNYKAFTNEDCDSISSCTFCTCLGYLLKYDTLYYRIDHISAALSKVAKESTISERADSNIYLALKNPLQCKYKP